MSTASAEPGASLPRFGNSLSSCRCQRAGDYDSARQQLRDVLAVEVVPYYRAMAQGPLDDLADDPGQ
nr:DUF2379 family protein [Pyxidicoccus trucidator]